MPKSPKPKTYTEALARLSRLVSEMESDPAMSLDEMMTRLREAREAHALCEQFLTAHEQEVADILK